MSIACIPHTRIPSSSALFLDLLYAYPRVRSFYPHSPTPEGALAAAAEIDYPSERRARVVAALRAQNADGGPAVAANLDKLARPGTAVVATGQQVGWLGGPAFAVYKALAAARLAEDLEARGVAAAPVFWLATEDHDADEVSKVDLLDAASRPLSLRVRVDGPAGAPVGRARIADPPVGELRAAFAGLDFGDEALELALEASEGGPAFGEAFARLWRRLLGPRGLILLDPMDPALRAVAAPLVGEALDRAPELAAALAERGRRIEAAGYSQQVVAPADGVLVFRFEGGRRTPLRRDGEGYRAGKRTFSAAEMAALTASEPEAFSPNALLRPVVQDYLLPTAALVGGPAELAYWAQSAVVYERLLGRMPAVLPRAAFTLLDARSAKLLDKYGLSAPDCMTHLAGLRERLARRLTPPSLREAFQRRGGEVDAALAGLRAALAEFDPTLAEALDRSVRKIRYQLTKIEGKAMREALRRDERAGADAERLAAWIYPQRTPQERRYSVLTFHARFGPRLYDTLYGATRPECPDHQVLAL